MVFATAILIHKINLEWKTLAALVTSTAVAVVVVAAAAAATSNFVTSSSLFCLSSFDFY